MVTVSFAVDPNTGRLVEYRTSVNLSFGVMGEED
jgi:hypothetical protein